MIAILLALGLALAGDGTTLATGQAHTVWVGPAGAPVLDDGDLCRRTSTRATVLPAGLRVQVEVIEPDCGPAYLQATVPPTGFGLRQRVYLDPSAVQTVPPNRGQWEAEPGTGRAFIKAAAEPYYAVGVPLDDPSWRAPLRLASGTPITVLDADFGVVRTKSGRELAVDRTRITTLDPLAGAGAKVREPLERFESGRVRWEAKGPVQDLPAADALLAQAIDQQGRAYQLHIRLSWLDEPRLDPAWIDPIGHLITGDCAVRGRRVEPCGTYYLDYTAFGAWWPARNTDVIAVVDGIEQVDGLQVPRLRVLVKEPWEVTIEVATAWTEGVQE